MIVRDKLHTALVAYPDMKVLIFSNSRLSAEGSLLLMSEKVIESLKLKGEAISLSGDSGIMLKSFLMTLFSADGEALSDIDRIDDMDDLLVMPVTSTAKCGFSSNKAQTALSYGLPPSFYDCMQFLGRLKRKGNASIGVNQYTIVLNLDLVIGLYIRILRTANKDS